MVRKLIVFDLDFTLWDAAGTWCDHTFPPYCRVNGYVQDSKSNIILLYPDVISILKKLSEHGYLLAVASRTSQPMWAERLLNLFEIKSYFNFKEIYPSPKTLHFEQLRSKSGIEYCDMLFFDDEQRNIFDVESLGVKSIHVKDGISFRYIEKNLE